MVEQPIKVEQPLVYDVLVGITLILKNDRTVVLVNAKAVDAATLSLVIVNMVNVVLARKKANPEERLHVLFNKGLGLLFKAHGFQFNRLYPRLQTKQHYIAHCKPLTLMISRINYVAGNYPASKDGRERIGKRPLGNSVSWGNSISRLGLLVQRFMRRITSPKVLR